jgi:hypothetical protein
MSFHYKLCSSTKLTIKDSHIKQSKKGRSVSTVGPIFFIKYAEINKIGMISQWKIAN